MPQALKIPDAKAAVENEKNREKYQHGIWRMSETRMRWSMKQGIKAEKFILRHWWISVISRIRSWNLNFKNTEVESHSKMADHSGSYEVFSEQESSAFQKTARLPGCAGQATLFIPAYTIVIQKNQSRNVQIFGYVHRSTNGQNHGPAWKIRLFLLNEICTVTLWQDYFGKGNSRKFFLKYGWEKVPNWECLFVNREKGVFLSVYVDVITLAGKKQNINPTWKTLMKDVDLGEPSFFDHVYLGCTQRECQISKGIVANYRDMFESRISAGAKAKLPTRASGKPDSETISSWSYEMEAHAKKKCVERFCELANKTKQQLYKVAAPCMDDHQFKKKLVSEWENCLQFAHKLFSHVCIWLVLGDLIFCGLWTGLRVL